MTKVEWVAPAPLWSDPVAGVDRPSFTRPWLAEFDTDDFIPAFLALMDGETPAALGASAPASSKLFQPIHQRYYLVVGSLVCRQYGLPDHGVIAKDGQRVSFVVRRLRAGGEQAWVGTEKSGRWAAAPNQGEVVDGEERLPMHPAPTAVALGRDMLPGRRAWYGYVPVSRRDSYLEPMADPVQTLAAVQQGAPAGTAEDPRLSEFSGMVLLPWQSLFAPVGDPVRTADKRVPSLHILLNLRDWLATSLPAVAQAVGVSNGASLPAAQRRLFDELNATDVMDGGARRPLAAVLRDLNGYAPLVAFLQTVEPAKGPYDVSQARHKVGVNMVAVDADYLRPAPGEGALSKLVHDALTEGGAPVRVPPELVGMVKDDTPDSPDATYVLRLVYEHDPCRPVLSAPTNPVQFAKVFDPEAPARKVHIQLPDISNLRQFKRGVGMEMSAPLRQVMDRVHKGLIKGEDLGPAGGFDLGMICSFSLPIITLVAFIVMFIFLLVLNFVFWWMAFLKICFPIPRKKS